LCLTVESKLGFKIRDKNERKLERAEKEPEKCHELFE
jgi:hypothetical protein